MTKKSAALAILTIGALGAGGSAAFAQAGTFADGQITDLFNTGFSSGGSGSLITSVSSDGHYSLTTVAPNPGGLSEESTPTTGAADVDPTTNANFNFPFYYNLGSGNQPAWDSAQYADPSQWILPQNSGGLSNGTGEPLLPTDPVGYYIYTTTFNINSAQTAANTLIELQAEVDNDLTGIILNPTTTDTVFGSSATSGAPGPSLGGATLNGSSGGFSSVINLNKGGFQSGTNTLEFIVYNEPPQFADGSADPVGLRVQIDQANAPEPGSLALLVLGAAPVVGMVRRRRNRRSV